MVLTKEQKEKIIKKFAKHEGDTGSPEVQIALLTKEIELLTKHLQTHKHDFHSRRGLFQKVGHRRKLLEHLKKKDINSYRNIIDKLKLRK